MPTERLEVRLDEAHRRKLAELARDRGVPMSVAVRKMIDEAYEHSLRERRRRAARSIGAMAVEDVPGPDVLARQLEEGYEPTGLS
ncbi:MAG: ribbon-helix-helix protein, CopG family [Chloroflexi bacterium]|nr:ribbon-helix-helix protein, CopG family [Chloroflexota bacterium]